MPFRNILPRVVEKLFISKRYPAFLFIKLNYGVFIDLGGMDGLIYITDISWKRISHPSEVLSLGQKINVKVIKFDEEKRRVSLGYK